MNALSSTAVLAQPDRMPTLVPFLPAVHLDAVLVTEALAYEFPWTRGNFSDSVAAGYSLQVLQKIPGGEIIGHLVAMRSASEMHLLNLAVHPAHQSQGHGRYMLADLLAMAQQNRDEALWLEVRRSNLRACRLYQRFGFTEVGQRKAYYPASNGPREDAVVMRMAIPPRRSSRVLHALD